MWAEGEQGEALKKHFVQRINASKLYFLYDDCNTPAKKYISKKTIKDNKKCKKPNQQPLRCDAYEKFLKLEAVQLFILGVGLTHLLHRSHQHWALFSLIKTPNGMRPSRPMAAKNVEVQIAWEWTGLHLLMTNTAVQQARTRNRDYMVLYSFLKCDKQNYRAVREVWEIID